MANPIDTTRPASTDAKRSGVAEPTAATPVWRRAMVYGLGVSGTSVSRLLLRRGTEVVAFEDKAGFALPPDLTEDARFELLTGATAEAFDAQTVDLVVVSPGVPRDREVLQLALDAGHPLRAEVEVAYQLMAFASPAAATKIVGITGSNGKSTTTQLVEELLGTERARACGNIGVPLSDCVRELELANPPVHAVELSSFQLEGVDQFRARTAALLNISPDHLDRHGSAARYVEAKRQIFKAQQNGDVAVLNADDEVVVATKTNQGVRRRLFSLLGPVEDGCYLDQDRVWLAQPGRQPTQIFQRSDLALVGDHNLANVMAAVLLALPFGLDLEGLPATLSHFAGLPHRTQLIAEGDGVRWYDDSKGTNVGATETSLRGFKDNTVHLIAGGRAKGGDFTVLREAVARKAVRLYLVGEAAEQLRGDLSDLVEVELSGTIESAVRAARDRALPGEVVLLSPACASFDQFPNFVERGLAFQRAVARTLPTLESGGEHG